MTFRIILIETKTWLRTIWYNIKNYKKIKEAKKQEELQKIAEAKKTPQEKMQEELAKKSPQELKRINKRIEELRLRGRPIICANCKRPGITKQTGAFIKTMVDGEELYIHEACK